MPLHGIVQLNCNINFLCTSNLSCIRYDPLSSCLVDFKGRANIASVKNFQLVQSYPVDSDGSKSQEIDGDKDYILQVGKVISVLHLQRCC